MDERPLDRAEVVVVGGGHNGLICAAYLARAGLDVCVVEKNETCGGALYSTSRAGVTLELGAVDHSTIVASPIPEELELERHGLEYIYRTNNAMHLFGDGTEIAIAADPKDTARSIAQVDEADASAWFELVDLSRRLMGLTAELSNGRNVPMSVALRAGRLALGRKGRPLMELATMPVADLAQKWFRSPHMRALAIFRTAFSGLPASYPGTGAFFCLTPAGHGRRYARPRGGSPAFVAALERAVTSAGGRIEPGFAVSTVTQRSDGWEVRSRQGSMLHASRAVVSAIPPQDLVLDMIQPHDAIPAKLRQRFERVEVVSGNLSQFGIASVLRERPDLGVVEGSGFEGSMLWLLADPSAALESQAAALTGDLAPRPSVIVTIPSIVDVSLGKPPNASMWINSFMAHQLDRVGGWESARAEAADTVWATIEACLPGLRDRVTESILMTPDDLSARTGATNAATHLAPTLDQLLGDRPVRGSAQHRLGVPGIYLTGAGTHPGPSVSGLPGRACAEAVLADLARSNGRGRRAQRARWMGAERSRARNLVRLTRQVRSG
ncbi:MAG: NAD(P)/FAD-dependent oxidoreductase [Acidimicrobiia bacterium]